MRGELVSASRTPTIDRLVSSPQLESVQELLHSGGKVIDGAIDIVGEIYDRQRSSLINLLLLLAAGISLYVVIGLMEVINRIPLFETALKSVGIVMSGLFVARNLWATEKRQQTIDRVFAYKNAIVGTQSYPTRTVSSVEPTGNFAKIAPTNAAIETPAPQPKSNGIDELWYLFLASQVELIDDASKLAGLQHQTTIEGGKIGVIAAEGEKCDRCWNYSPTVGDSSEYPTICDRCVDALAGEF